MRWIVGGHAVTKQAGLEQSDGALRDGSSGHRENLTALARSFGQWIDRVHERHPPKMIVLDMDSSVSPTHGDQEGSAYNGHFRVFLLSVPCSCSTSSAIWNGVLSAPATSTARRLARRLEPVIERYRKRDLRRYFRGDAAFASPDIYEFLEAEAYTYAIRLKANAGSSGKHRPSALPSRGRPPNHVRRYYASFSYQAGKLGEKRRIVAKVEWHPGELYPRVGFIVTNLSRPAERVVAFYNQRAKRSNTSRKARTRSNGRGCRAAGSATMPSGSSFTTLAYNLANFMRTLALPKEVEHWSLTTLREKLVKIGAKVVSHGRYVTFQLAEVAVPEACSKNLEFD